MRLAIAQAFNGEHDKYKKYASDSGMNPRLFDIDSADWLDRLPLADAYLWHADSKEHNYRVIHDRVYFIENILKKPIFPDMNMYFAYGDKIKEADIFKYFQIPTPKTYISYDKKEALDILDKIEYPFVLKGAHGYGGLHIKKIAGREEAVAMIERIFSDQGIEWGVEQAPCLIKDYFLAQEMADIKKDIRVIIIGSQPVCAYWRRSESDWKHNIGLGSKAYFSDIPKEAINMCLELHKKMGFHWMSYDVFVLDDGSCLMNEFSCNFGIKAPTEEGYEIRKMQVAYIKEYLKKYA